jgi:hypothetical protein
MAQFGRYRLLVVAVVFHLVYIYSIFSIYFVSPIVHGMREHRVETQEPPAKRLVLFVGMEALCRRVEAANKLHRRRSPRRQDIPVLPEP